MKIVCCLFFFKKKSFCDKTKELITILLVACVAAGESFWMCKSGTPKIHSFYYLVYVKSLWMKLSFVCEVFFGKAVPLFCILLLKENVANFIFFPAAVVLPIPITLS